MANIATFSADFSQFDAALAQAREKLEGFAVSGRGVAASLERLARSFSGAQIIAEAQKVAAAVEAIGGASKLTEAEQRKVNATVTEALAKYRALGQEAPAALTKLARETTPVVSGLGQIGSIAAGLVTGQAIVAFAERAVTSLRQLTIGLIEAGDRFDDLAVRTGVSRTDLQRWEYAAAQTNTTLDAVVRGSEQLAQRITEGSTDVRRAVQALGLSLEDLRQQSPADLLRTVGQAIASVEDATERTARARELLGRTGGELIPLLMNLERLGDEAVRVGAVMSDDLVRASGDFTDAWVAVKAAGRGVLIEALEPMVPILNAVAQAMRESLGPTERMGLGWETLKASMRDSISIAGGVIKSWETLRDLLIAFGPLSQQIPPASPLRAWREEIAQAGTIALPSATEALRLLDEQLREHRRDVAAAEAAAKKWRAELDALTGRDRIAAADALLQKLRAIGDPSLISPAQFAEIRTTMEAAQEAAIRLGEAVNREWQAWIDRVGVLTFRLRNELMPALESVAVVAEALPSRALPGGGMTTLPTSPTGVAVPTGGGSFWQTLGTLFQRGQGVLGLLGGLGLGGFGGAAGRVLGGAASGFALGSTAGSFLGAASVLGPFGALAGGAIGLFRALFGPDEETRVVNPRRDQFLAQFGGPGTGPGSGFHNLATLLSELPATMGGGPGGGQLFRDLISADTAKEYEAAVTRINAVLQQRNSLLTEQASIEAQLAELQKAQVPTWAEVAQLAEQYGISIDNLGPAIQELRQQDIASQLLHGLDRLIAAGGDVGGILQGMREEISAFVRDSLKFGTTVPENLRPYIEELLRSGQLLDENGQAMTDLSQLKWGPPIKTQSEIISEAMEKLIARLEEIADILAGRLPASAREGTEEIDRIIREYDPPEIVIPTRVEGPSGGGGGDLTGFQTGSHGLRDFGAGTLAVLHGREAVLTESQYQALRRQGGGDVRIEVPVILDGREIARSTARWQADWLPVYGIG